ncbi:MAG TPA: ATP-binding protein [Ktedonobacterales bacterium]
MQADATGAASEARDALADIGRALARLEGRAVDLTLLTAAETGALDVSLQRRALRAVAQAAASDARARAARFGLTLRCDVSACRDATARIDLDLMRHALGALLDNAIRFSPTGAPVTLVAERDGEWGRFIVRDQGAGILPDDVPNIFKPFAVGANEDEARDSGLGLGLAVARAIAEAHNGRLRVLSEMGPGAAVAIELPLA